MKLFSSVSSVSTVSTSNTGLSTSTVDDDFILPKDAIQFKSITTEQGIDKLLRLQLEQREEEWKRDRLPIITKQKKPTSLLTPYHHYDIFYAGDNNYNLLQETAVRSFRGTQSLKCLTFGKSSPTYSNQSSTKSGFLASPPLRVSLQSLVSLVDTEEEEGTSSIIDKIKKQAIRPIDNKLFDGNDIICIASGFDSTFFLGKSGRIWSIGENSSGQLGHEGSELKEIPKMKEKDIVEIISRGEHVIFRSKYDKLYGCGKNDRGQLGLGHVSQTSEVVLIPFDVDRLKNSHIMQICCGYDHTVILTNSGMLFITGDNRDFQLGFPSKEDYVNTFTHVDTNFSKSKIVKVGAGDYHTVLLNKDGEVFVTGSNKFSEIASYKKPVKTFTLQRELKEYFKVNIVDIYTFSLTTYFRDTLNNVYVAGDNQFGQACVGFDSESVPLTMCKYLSNPNIKDIFVGKCHVIYTMISETNPKEIEIYSIGFNEYGQLGIPPKEEDEFFCTPIRLYDLETLREYKRKSAQSMVISSCTFATLIYFLHAFDINSFHVNVLKNKAFCDLDFIFQ
ncbi:hypothetical protein ABK040_016712 [Willaertia magna]